jgi:hypothetical protein
MGTRVARLAWLRAVTALPAVVLLVAALPAAAQPTAPDAGSGAGAAAPPVGVPTVTPTASSTTAPTASPTAVPTTAPQPLQTAPASMAPLLAGEQIGAGWRVAALPQQKAPVTRYTVETVGERVALRIDAKASYGNLVHEMNGAPAPRVLSWAWRLQQANPAIDLTTKSGDDQPAKVCLSFDLPLSRVPFVERQLLRMARARSGENLPAATLCWVWAGAEGVGDVLPNAYTRRVRYVVLRNRDSGQGAWLLETRDVAADWRRAFGDESPTPPPVSAVVVAGDADNTGGHSVAHVTAMRWLP